MIVQTPHDELVRVAEALDNAVGDYVSAAACIEPNGYWEAPLLGLAMSWSAARNVEAVTLLARTDEVLLPAAWANARAAFEISTRAIWLLFPGDRFEAEMRWIAMVDEYRRYHENMFKAGCTVSYLDRHKDAVNPISAFLEGVKSRVPENYTPATHIPSVGAILDEVGATGLSAVYIEGSQYLHGTIAGAAVYIRGLGYEKVVAERVALRDWILPLRISWLGLREAGKIVTDRLSDGARTMDWGNTSAAMDSLFQEMARADPSR
jgi:hypothetical protein